MLGALLELIGGLVFEFLFYLILDLVFGLAYQLLRQPFRPRRETHPIVAGVGALVLGAILGGISLLLTHHRLVPLHPVAGASLVLAPLGGATAMELFGRASESRGYPASFLATWWAGGLLAFGFALVRFLIVGGT